MICYRGLKFPHKGVVLLVLESDAACTSFNGHSARKLQCWFNYDAIKPEVIENKICEGTDCLNAALSSGTRSLQVMVDPAMNVYCGSNKTVTLLYLVPWASTKT